VLLKRSTLAATLLLLALPTDAHAAFPGENGKIAYDRYDAETDETAICLIDPGNGGQCPFVSGVEPSWSVDGTKLAYTNLGIRTVNADGSGAASVTSDSDGNPAWSPDGFRIAFSRFANACVPSCIGEIYRIGMDGTGETRLTNDPANDDHAAWSPNGQLIAWERDGSIWTMGPDGSDKIELGPGSSPNWSPGGAKLAFEHGGIWVMNADGTGRAQLTSGSDSDPAWSPDGTKIAFTRHDNANETEGIWMVDSDGSDEAPVVTESGFLAVLRNPDWQPLPVNTPSSYIRPKATGPMRVSIVSAAKPCTTPNRTHGPPLAYGSCSPVLSESPNLTVGIGDGSPAFSKSIGFVRLDAIVGTPGGPDDSDLDIRFSLTNVMKLSDLSDYAGELRGRLDVRFTDKPPGATTEDFPFGFTIPCTPTSDTTLGATCGLATTADTLVPGSIPEGARSVWGLDQVRVYDGGPDGDADTAGDNSLFEVQGVFVP
jgi:hypothetical protein